MLDVSEFIWKTIPLMNYFQFPWRLLSLEIIFASFLAGSIFSLNIKNKFINFSIAVFLIFLVFILGIGYAKPAYYMYRDDSYYLTKANFMNGTNSPGNVFNTIYLKSIPSKEKEKAIFVKGAGRIIVDKTKSNYYAFTVQASTNSQIQANIAYFPGWEVYINDKKEPLKFTRNRLFTFIVPSGINKVEIIFKDTLVRKLAALIFITSLGAMVALLISKRSVTIKK